MAFNPKYYPLGGILKKTSCKCEIYGCKECEARHAKECGCNAPH